MSQQAYIVDVTPENLQEMLNFSAKRPLVLHFWDPLNADSVHANTLLETLAQQLGEKFILGRLNCGQQSELAARFGVNQLPHIKLVIQGQLAAELSGLQTLPAYQEWLLPHLPQDPSETLRAQAQQAFLQGAFEQAVKLLGEAAQADPENVKVPLDLVQMYLLNGHLDKARQLFDKLPPEAHASGEGKRIHGLLFFADIVSTSQPIETLQQRLQLKPEDAQALHQFAAYLVIHQQPEQAIAVLFKLFASDRGFGDGAAQQALITLFDMLAQSHPQLVMASRRKLQGMLY